MPYEVHRYAGHPRTLPVGHPGKVGLLDLTFAKIGERTELVRHYQKSPLQIMRPLYFDPYRPDMPITFVMSTGGGIVQADRLRLDLHFGPHSAGHITTQAATKVHSMDHDYAIQQAFVTAEENAYVEYMPDMTIPHPRSRLYQRTVVTAHPTATVLVSEYLMVGRLARGERHQYDVLAADFELRRPDGALVALDTVRLDPGSGTVTGPAVLARHDLMASLFCLTPLVPADEIADTLHAVLAERGLSFGVSVLPGEAGAWVRLLGSDPLAVTAALEHAWSALRHLLTGYPAPHLRKS
ncbi:urease accessory protein UreD [Streptomyces violascens]|uniref:urease accessory protein UreD n=1 Tax=Streptomyces violascens TaxID=67381 RepID=UPI0036A1B03D